MKSSKTERPSTALPTSDVSAIPIKPVRIGLRSRCFVWLMRHVLRPYMNWLLHGSNRRIANAQLMMASQICRDSAGLSLDYRVIGRVPGHWLGPLADTRKPVLLYLHGGAFLLPAVPDVHVTMVARLCRDLDAVGFVPDYRLAPFNRFPAALDDCERAYRELLDRGFTRILIAGESAGGALVLGLLQRIRKAVVTAPVCAVAISPVTELGRVHAPPSRAIKRRSDPILPMQALERVGEMLAGGQDTSHPELSPLYMDCGGLPPIYLLASDNEVLLDDTVLLARRLIDAGVRTKIDVWPLLPHAFPLFERVFPEVRAAREDIAAFMRDQLAAPR